MYRQLQKLSVYRDVASDTVLSGIAGVCAAVSGEHYDRDELISSVYRIIHILIEEAESRGFSGNLWHCHIIKLLTEAENAFSLACERAKVPAGSITSFARDDIRVLCDIMSYDLASLDAKLGCSCLSQILSYNGASRGAGNELLSAVNDFTASPDGDTLFEIITGFYKNIGVGSFAVPHAFRIKELETSARLEAIEHTENVAFDDIVGYDWQKAELRENTEAFICDRGANNVLLYGDAGTGKSSSVKAVMCEYHSRGLRMIEIYRHQFRFIPSVIEQIKNRNYHFILFMDDLSFEENETEYKYLKALIEGGLEERPKNVLIYATSNRWHLIKETWNDRNDTSNQSDVRRSDSLEEKLSLYDRFGLTINYSKPEQSEYLNIVNELAARHDSIRLSQAELEAQAKQWEMAHGGKSGRTARQFITHLLGKAED